MALTEETIRNLKLYALPSVVLIFLLVTIALVIVVYVDNRTINEHVTDTNVGYMESVKTANGFAGTVKDHQLTMTTTTPIGLMQASKGIISAADPDLVTSALLNDYVVDPSGKINADDTILDGFNSLMTRSTLMTGFISGPDNLDNHVANDETVIQSISNLQGQLNAAQLLYLFRADNPTVALGVSDTLIWSAQPMIFGLQFVPANTLVEGDVLYFETSASLAIVAESDTTTTMNVLPSADFTTSLIHLIPATYLYTSQNWITMVTQVSPTAKTFGINSVITAINNATGNVFTVNSTSQSQTLNPQLQQQFELALKVNTGAPVFDVSSAYGKFDTKSQS